MTGGGGGMYNLVFGENRLAGPMLSLLRWKDPSVDFGRVRDAWLERAGDWLEIRVHTRNGGGNREDQKPAIDSMRAHPWYLRDADMPFDTTYADFYFHLPFEEVPELDDPEVRRKVAELAVDPVDMNERWAETIASIGKN